MIYAILGHGSLRLESEDSLYDFISKGIETNREMFGLLDFVRFEYCSTDVMTDFLDLLSEQFYKINTSMWASLRARLVLPIGIWEQFPPSVKKGKIQMENSFQLHNTTVEIDVPDGIIAHLTRECGGNVHDSHVVDVTCGSFRKEAEWTNPNSRAYGSRAQWAAKNAADLGANSFFHSANCCYNEDILHTRNN
jgi:hypothetical protein